MFWPLLSNSKRSGVLWEWEFQLWEWEFHPPTSPKVGLRQLWSPNHFLYLQNEKVYFIQKQFVSLVYKSFFSIGMFPIDNFKAQILEGLYNATKLNYRQ